MTRTEFPGREQRFTPMSFGRPPSINIGFKSAPPERGSFPLDHYGECKDQMIVYMRCLKENSSTSTPCRALSKQYLDCRMKKGLMERDEWKNLGLANVDSTSSTEPKTDSSTTTPPQPAPTPTSSKI